MITPSPAGNDTVAGDDLRFDTEIVLASAGDDALCPYCTVGNERSS